MPDAITSFESMPDAKPWDPTSIEVNDVKVEGDWMDEPVKEINW